MSDSVQHDVDDERRQAWAAARRIAENPSTAGWQRELVRALEIAVCPHAAGVFLCRLGNLLQATSAVAPVEYSALGERLVNEFLPSLQRSGALTPGQLFANEETDDDLHSRLAVQVELLAPSGFTRLLGVFLRNEDGMLCGWLTIFVRSRAEQHAAELLVPLRDVARAAEAAIRGSLSIASVVGARFPKISADPLSDRELEIARMAANGFSDLNIARQLGISEGTVGRHLHNIYRKLGIGSRLELADLLCVPN